MKKFILLMALITQVAIAAIIEDERGKALVDIPEGWTYEKNILGLPHVFMSSEKPEKTSVSLTLTGLEGVKLKMEDLKKNQGQYQDGRRTWALDREAKIVKFLPYENFKLKSHSAHSIGVTYELGGKTYEEISYYVECPLSFVHMKLLGVLGSQGVSAGKNLMKSLSCQ